MTTTREFNPANLDAKLGDAVKAAAAYMTQLPKYRGGGGRHAYAGEHLVALMSLTFEVSESAVRELLTTEFGRLDATEDAESASACAGG
jgi:hypothetical protein